MKRLLLVSLFFAVRAFALDANAITPANVTALMNQYRADAGLPPLRIDPSLTAAAEARMREMAEGEWWGHEAPDGTPPFVHIPIDYDYAFAAENLAAGFDTAGVLVLSWMESPGHRANILGAKYADCGIAILDGSTKGPSTGQSIVVLFGRRKVQMVSAR
ncbi:MAG TPA: CAP domain-containing protein [Thermoanaerobaculia bacterium]|nr:CAP domain-containing protein [Thermoanaerobaculia bacterium]